MNEDELLDRYRQRKTLKGLKLNHKHLKRFRILWGKAKRDRIKNELLQIHRQYTGESNETIIVEPYKNKQTQSSKKAP